MQSIWGPAPMLEEYRRNERYWSARPVVVSVTSYSTPYLIESSRPTDRIQAEWTEHYYPNEALCFLRVLITGTEVVATNIEQFRPIQSNICRPILHAQRSPYHIILSNNAAFAPFTIIYLVNAFSLLVVPDCLPPVPRTA